MTSTLLRITIAVAVLGLALATGAIATARQSSVRVGEAGLAHTGALTIPLHDERDWERLRYRGIPPNNVVFGETGLHIRVDRSAGPLIYPLPSPRTVTHLTVHGRLDGELRVGGDQQGEQGFDDYALRAGLVLAGNRRLRGLERLFAPEWVKKLYALAPSGEGISVVRFFNVGADLSQFGNRRRHPLNDLLEEEVVAAASADGTFEIDVTLSPPVKTIGLWLASDGDDTGSAFSVVIARIALQQGVTP